MKTGYNICKLDIFLKINGDGVPADVIRSVFNYKKETY